MLWHDDGGQVEAAWRSVGCSAAHADRCCVGKPAPLLDDWPHQMLRMRMMGCPAHPLWLLLLYTLTQTNCAHQQAAHTSVEQ